MTYNLQELVKQWDRLSSEGHGGWKEMECLQWFNYLAFDIIGDLVSDGMSPSRLQGYQADRSSFRHSAHRLV